MVISGYNHYRMDCVEKEASVVIKDIRNSKQSQVEAFLLDMINTGVWKVGDKIQSERDLSVELGASRTTIRNAVLNLTRKGLFERVTGQGTFVKRIPYKEPEPSKTQAKTGNIGYIICKEKAVQIPLLQEAFYFDVFSGIAEVAAKSKKDVLFAYVDDFNVEESEHFDTFLKKVDGVIIEEAFNVSFLERIKMQGTPAVLFAPTAYVEGFDIVTMDVRAGMKKAVEYFHSIGHSRIGIINGPLHLETARQRFQGWQDAVKEQMEEIPEALVGGGEGWTVDHGHRAMLELLRPQTRPTAVVCANELLAFGAMSAISESDLKVPEDVSVIGFDDTYMASLSHPSLTSMKIYSRQMAHTATKRLFERMEDHNLPAITTEFPIDLIIRKSCKEVHSCNVI